MGASSRPGCISLDRREGLGHLIEEGVEGSNTSKLALQVTQFKMVKAQSGSSCRIPTSRGDPSKQDVVGVMHACCMAQHYVQMDELLCLTCCELEAAF